MSTAPALTPKPISNSRWLEGNDFKLLENGDEYFPAVYEEIAAAERELIIETFILFDDVVGRELQRALIEAAKRGVSVDLTVDGYGSPDLTDEYIAPLVAAGVRFHVFDPRPRLFGMRTNVFRRMHRKIVAVDDRVAFVGGINFSVDHRLDYGAMAKQDYSVRIEGPLAQEIHSFARAQVGHRASHWWRRKLHWPRSRQPQNSGQALFVFRDNELHRDDIERHYRAAIRAAQHEVLIAVAYFFPGYRLLKQLRRAARRGVRVQLILQGKPDMDLVKFWAGLLYPPLLNSGVQIYEYMTRPLHAKIAAIDGTWCTIGSSNLDPLSLALNLEANIIARDPALIAVVQQRLRGLLQESHRIDPENVPKKNRWRSFVSTLGYHATRYFPTLALWLPVRRPIVESIGRGMQRSRALEVRESR